MLKNKLRTQVKAFTIIEVLIAVVILTVLVGMVVPGFLNQLEESKGGKALENLHNIRSAEIFHLGEYGFYTANLADLQKYSSFVLSDGDWTYTVGPVTDATFVVTATRSGGAFSGQTITLNELSEVNYAGTTHIAGGTWPP